MKLLINNSNPKEKKKFKKQEMRHNLKILEKKTTLTPKKAVTGLNKKNITKNKKYERIKRQKPELYKTVLKH